MKSNISLYGIKLKTYHRFDIKIISEIMPFYSLYYFAFYRKPSLRLYYDWMDILCEDSINVVIQPYHIFFT